MFVINSALFNNTSIPCCNKAQANFGMRISKLGRQIDAVLAVKGSEPDNVAKLRCMLEDYFKKSPCSVGMGFQEKVFAIDDKYVIKARNASFCDTDKFSIDTKGGSRLSGLKSYFGGVLMRFGNFKILRNVSSNGKHTPAGIPLRMLADYDKDALEVYYNTIYLPTFAQLPQRSFDRLAKDFACLNSKTRGLSGGLQFDINNSNNIVLAGTSTLRIVDDINDVPMAQPNRVAALLDMFLKKANASMLAPQTENNKALRFELFKKLILAGEKYELPLSFDSVYDKKVWEMVCDFGKSGEQVVSDLTAMRNDIKNKKTRIQMVEDYLNNMMLNNC